MFKITPFASRVQRFSLIGKRWHSRTPPPPKEIHGVKQVIAVSSNKGGVGKSTTAGTRSFVIHLQHLMTKNK